jgi:hypothetical protein
MQCHGVAVPRNIPINITNDDAKSPCGASGFVQFVLTGLQENGRFSGFQP